MEKVAKPPRRALILSGVVYLLILALVSLWIVYQVFVPTLFPTLDRENFEYVQPAPGAAVDLHQWNPDADGMVSLLSGWDFYWKRLLFSVPTNEQSDPDLEGQTIRRSWTSYLDDSGQNLPWEGYATYQIDLRLPIPEVGETPLLALRTGRISTAASVYWNGQRIYSFGTPATQRTLSDPEWRSTVIPIPASAFAEHRSGVHRLTIEVSNFHSTSAGLTEPLRLGSFQRATQLHLFSHLGSFFLVGIFLIMSLYHVFTFFSRRTEVPALMFGLICGFLSVRILAQGDMPLAELLPILSFEALTKINFLTFTFLVPPFAVYLVMLYPFRGSKILVWASIVVSALYSIVILGYPSWVYTQVLVVYQVFAVLFAAILVVRLGHALFRRLPNSGLLSVGFLAVVATMVLDIASANDAIYFPSIVPFGILVFVFCQSLILISRSSRAMEESEALGGSLRRMNDAMERFIPREFFAAIHKHDVTEVELGDHSLEQMTVMVADIKNFSGMVERLTPKETFEALNALMAEIVPLVRKHGGFVNTYLADGFIGLFPAGPKSAVEAGVEIQHRLVALGNTAGVSRRIEMGMGIHFGDVMIGTVGEESRMNTTVVSDTVYIAEKIQDLTRTFQCSVLVSEPVRQSLGNSGSPALRNLGGFQFRGKSVPIQLFEVYEADRSEDRDAKRRTQRDFERSVFLFQHRQAEKASALLEKIHDSLERPDAAVDYYRQILAKAAPAP